MTKNQIREVLTRIGADLPPEDASYEEHEQALIAAHGSGNGNGNDTGATDATAEESPFYCPGCGRRWNFMTECNGMNANTPHPAIEVISTDELSGDPENHTPAPDSPGA